MEVFPEAFGPTKMVSRSRSIWTCPSPLKLRNSADSITVEPPYPLDVRLEEPVPRRFLTEQVTRAAELLPGQPHLGQTHPAEPGLPHPIGDFERLPEVLLQPLVAEAAEGEVVVRVFGE